MSSILLWKPSVMPLLRVKRHMATISSDAQETRHQLFTLSAVAMFFQQQTAEPLFEVIDGLQYRMLGQIGGSKRNG